MPNTLISFIGTGVIDKSGASQRKYREAQYSLNGKLLGKSSFVTAILYDYLNIDNLILIGTAKSMWEEVYDFFCDKRGLPKDEDYYVELGDLSEKATHASDLAAFNLKPLEHALGSNSAVKLIPYGLNDHELFDIFHAMTDLFNQIPPGSTVYLDITHAFRSLPLFSLAAINYLKDVLDTEFDLRGVYYGMLEAMREFDGVAPIIDLSMMVKLQEWIKAAHSFTNHGRGYLAADLLDNPNDANTLRQFSDALAANHLQEIKTQIHKFRALAKRIDDPIAKMFLPKVLLDFVQRIDKKSNARFQLALSIWQREKKNYLAAFTTLVEAFVTHVCECHGWDWTNKADRDKAKGNICPDLRKVFKETNDVRRALVHNNPITKYGKTKVDIDTLRKAQKEFLSHLKNHPCS